MRRAQQQSHAEPILERRDRFRDGRLADMQLLCCAGERAGLDDPDEGFHRGQAIPSSLPLGMKHTTTTGYHNAAGSGIYHSATTEAATGSSARQPFPHREDRSPKRLVQRLDRAFADINAFLLALAIGLAMLDIASFAATRSIDVVKPLLQVMQTAPILRTLMPASKP